jgi:hypothetical protein
MYCVEPNAPLFMLSFFIVINVITANLTDKKSKVETKFCSKIPNITKLVSIRVEFLTKVSLTIEPMVFSVVYSPGVYVSWSDSSGQAPSLASVRPHVQTRVPPKKSPKKRSCRFEPTSRLSSMAFKPF